MHRIGHLLSFSPFQWIILSQAMIVYFVSASPHVLRIREGTPAGTVLIPDLPTFLTGGTGVNQQLASSEYDSASRTESALLAIGNAVMPSASWLSINPSRGSLSVKTPPDRDALCPTEFKFPETAISIDRGGVEFQNYMQPSNGQSRAGIDPGDCVLEVSIVHGSPTNPSFDMLNIILEDVNDHAPIFLVNDGRDPEGTEYVIKVPESTAVVSMQPLNAIQHGNHLSQQLRIPLPLAKDPDYGVNGIRGYRLEGQDAYLFRLEVGPPENLGTSELEYAKLSTSTSSSSLYAQSKSSQLWLVPVDARTGRASLNYSPVVLDREERAEYQFVLVAFDGGSPQRTGRLPIRLVLEDLNDNAPKFNQAWYSGKLSENELPGHVLLEFSAYDRDGLGDNSRIGFRIPGEPETVGSHVSGLIGKGPEPSTTGLSDAQIAAAQYFAVEPITLDVPGSGGLQHPNSRMNATHGRLIVRRQSKEKVQIAASRALQVARKQISAGSNKQGVQDSYGAAALNIPTNLEESARLEFVIEAFDHGKPSHLSSRVPVYIQITDVNDHAPKIFVSYLREAEHLTRPILGSPTSSSTWGKVRENLSRAMLAQVTVTDEDTLYADTDIVCNTNDSRFTLEDITPMGHLGDLSGHWTRRDMAFADQPQISEDSTLPNDQFSERKTRVHRAILPTRMFKLMLNAPLDRESSSDHQMASIQFALICTDNARGQLPGGQLTTTATIRLLVEDANDNAPIFEQTHYTFRVPENYPSMKPNEMGAVSERYLIGRVHATDADEGWNSALEYRLVSNPSNALEVNHLTGQLYVTRPFDRESIGEVKFQILAIDCIPEDESKVSSTPSGTRKTGTAEVRLIIEDLNDSPPVFQEMNYHFEVEEGLDLIKVGQVWATDADQDEFARISYRLAVGPGSRFEDKFSAEQSVSQSLPSQLYDEALEINTHFQIDPTNGIIHLKGRLDRERRAHYEFVVLAVDNPRGLAPKLEGSVRSQSSEAVQFTGTATVLITVLDQNDNPPRIISPRNHAQFSLGPDQLIAGNTVFTIRATDPDLGENGTVEYSLLSVEDDLGSRGGAVSAGDGNNTSGTSHKDTGWTNGTKSGSQFPFSVDQTAGICYLRENLPPLNAGGPRAYLLRMRAYDLGRPQSLNTSLTVRVVRQEFSSIDPSATADSSGEQVMDASFRGHSPPSDAYQGEGKFATWTGVGQGRISDRTMVVILSTVFVLLLLTTIVLLLLVRYRRLFLRNISFGSTHSGDSSIGKGNIGKHYTGHPDSRSPTGLFPEVLTAPWVNATSSPIDSPNSFNYPTIYNQSNSLLIGDLTRGCVKNPGACWSPPGGGTCKSPAEFRRILANDNHASVFHTPPARIPGYDLEMLPRAQIPVKARRFDSSNETSFIEVPGTFVLENYALPDVANGEYRALTMDRRVQNFSGQTNQKNNRMMAFDAGLLVPNTWAKITTVQTSPQITHGHSTIDPVTFSLENLTEDRTGHLKEYKTILATTPTSECQTDQQSRSRNDYQLLSTNCCAISDESGSQMETNVMSDTHHRNSNSRRTSEDSRRRESQTELCSLLTSLISDPPRGGHDQDQPRHSITNTADQISQSSLVRDPQKKDSMAKSLRRRSNLKGRRMSGSNTNGNSTGSPVVTFETESFMENRTTRSSASQSHNTFKGISANADFKTPEKISPKQTRFNELQRNHPDSPMKSSNLKGSFV